MTLTRDKYLTLQAVAEILNVTERYIYDLIVEGSLTAIKVGSRAVRVSEQSLNDFIRLRTINPDDFFDPDKNKKEQIKTVRPQPTVAKSNWMKG